MINRLAYDAFAQCAKLCAPSAPLYRFQYILPLHLGHMGTNSNFGPIGLDVYRCPISLTMRFMHYLPILNVWCYLFSAFHYTGVRP